MSNSQKHFCIVGYNLAISDKLNNRSQLWPIAKRIVAQGHKISIISFKGSPGRPVMKDDNITAYFLGEDDLFVAREDFPEMALKKILEINEKDSIDHIHSIDTPFSVKRRKLRKKNITLSYSVQVLELDKFFLNMSLSKSSTFGFAKNTFLHPLLFLFKFLTKEWKTLKGSSGIFVSSPKEALALERYYLFPPKWIFQVPLNAEASSLLQRKKSEEVLSNLGINQSTPIIATASTMNSTNELEFLLSVFERVCLKYPKAKFVIIGNGKVFKEVERSVLLRALDSKVIFIKNFISQKIPDYVSIADVFINIKYETSGLGRTLIEAMAQEKVIIGSEFSAISEIITDGQNGFLIRPGEESKAFDLIHRIFSNQINKEEIGQKAREDILKALNPDNLAEKTLYAFDKIASRSL